MLIISHEGRVFDWIGHALVDFILIDIVALVIGKDLLIDRFLKLLLILQKKLLLRTCLLEHGHVEDVAVLAPIFVAWWCLNLMLLVQHVFQTVKLLESFFCVILSPVLTLILFLDFFARATRKWLLLLLLKQTHWKGRLGTAKGSRTEEEVVICTFATWGWLCHYTGYLESGLQVNSFLVR